MYISILLKVVLPSWESVKKLQPIRDDILKCPGKMLVVTAAAPPGSNYDFITRVFGPKIGVDEVKRSYVHLYLHLLMDRLFNLTEAACVNSEPCLWKCTLCISTLLEPQDEKV